MPRHRKQVPSARKSTFAARSAHAKARREFATYDTSAIRPKKNNKPLIAILAIVALVLILLFIFIIPGCFDTNKGSLSASETATVKIESGDSAKVVATKFEQAKLIANSDKFLDELKKDNVANSLIPGNYTFAGQSDVSSIINALKNGKVDSMPKLTVVEGFTNKSIAEALQSQTNSRITSQDFLNECADASKYASEFEFLKEVGNNSLEGFLVPKTYDIADDDTAASMIRKMLNIFKNEVANLDYSYPKNQNMSLYDVIKLSSIVQKESPTEYHARVAGIFYNRLKSSRPYLQSDATTAYVVGHDPTAEEVHANDPYSTYSNAGLPPTPICNPSIDSIKATLNPEQTDYMYFYTSKDGTYQFSVTYDEHLAAINKDN